MSQDEHTQLTDEERVAFAALPREADPGQLLEERTVRALYERGLLGRQQPRRSWSVAMVMTGVAASVAFFASGLAVGQWLATRTVATSIVTANHANAMQAAAAVQRSGSAYVAALAALGQLSDSANSESVAQGREVALAALYAAVSEFAALAPDDPLSVTVRDVLNRRAGADQTEIRNVVWF